MYPVAGVGDVLDVGAGEQPLDFWVILGAETRREKVKEGTGTHHIRDCYVCPFIT